MRKCKKHCERLAKIWNLTKESQNLAPQTFLCRNNKKRGKREEKKGEGKRGKRRKKKRKIW
jgi:hypothetical protein